MIKNKNYISRKKRNHLPFYDTWGKRAIITEIYIKPDYKTKTYIAWTTKEHDYFDNVYSIYFSRNVIVGYNGIFGA